MGSVEELFKTSLQPPVPASVHLLAQLQLLCPPPPHPLLLHPNPVTLLRLQLRRVWSLKLDPGSDPTLDVMFLVWNPGILFPRT